MASVTDAVINLTDCASFTAALESFPTLRAILRAIHRRVADRQRSVADQSIEAELELSNWELTLEIRQNGVVIMQRVKRLPKGFYSEQLFDHWHTDLPPHQHFQCSFERRAHDVVARCNHEAYAFNLASDRDALKKAVATLESIPDVLLEAHYSSAVLPRLTMAFYNEYLVDMLNADSFQCLSKERFDLMQGDRLFYEVKEVLERCGTRLALFRLLLGPVSTWITSHASSGGLPVVDTGLVDTQSLLKAFRNKLISVWAQF